MFSPKKSLIFKAIAVIVIITFLINQHAFAFEKTNTTYQRKTLVPWWVLDSKADSMDGARDRKSDVTKLLQNLHETEQIHELAKRQEIPPVPPGIISSYNEHKVPKTSHLEDPLAYLHKRSLENGFSRPIDFVAGKVQIKKGQLAILGLSSDGKVIVDERFLKDWQAIAASDVTFKHRHENNEPVQFSLAEFILRWLVSCLNIDEDGNLEIEMGSHQNGDSAFLEETAGLWYEHCFSQNSLLRHDLELLRTRIEWMFEDTTPDARDLKADFPVLGDSQEETIQFVQYLAYQYFIKKVQKERVIRGSAHVSDTEPSAKIEDLSEFQHAREEYFWGRETELLRLLRSGIERMKRVMAERGVSTEDIREVMRLIRSNRRLKEKLEKDLVMWERSFRLAGIDEELAAQESLEFTRNVVTRLGEELADPDDRKFVDWVAETLRGEKVALEEAGVRRDVPVETGPKDLSRRKAIIGMALMAGLGLYFVKTLPARILSSASGATLSGIPLKVKITFLEDRLKWYDAKQGMRFKDPDEQRSFWENAKRIVNLAVDYENAALTVKSMEEAKRTLEEMESLKDKLLLVNRNIKLNFAHSRLRNFRRELVEEMTATAEFYCVNLKNNQPEQLSKKRLFRMSEKEFRHLWNEYRAKHPLLRKMDDIKIGEMTGRLEDLKKANRDTVPLKPIDPEKNMRWKVLRDITRNIIIHHTATLGGYEDAIDRGHKRRGWGGIAYHFLIENGTYRTRDGQIDPTYRWIGQKIGGHCKGRIRKKSIGIALVGNFQRRVPTPEQVDSLVHLAQELSSYYDIPHKNIMGHGRAPGNHTSCPGRKFPWKEFWARLELRKEIGNDLEKLKQLERTLLKQGQNLTAADTTEYYRLAAPLVEIFEALRKPAPGEEAPEMKEGDAVARSTDNDGILEEGEIESMGEATQDEFETLTTPDLGKGVVGFVAEFFFTLMWHLNMRITPARRNFVEDVLVPIVEEGLMFLGLCYWGLVPYGLIRLIFIGLHAIQDRAPPAGEKRTPPEKIAIPVFISAAAMFFITVFGTTLTGFLLAAGIHGLANRYVTWSGSRLQKAVLGHLIYRLKNKWKKATPGIELQPLLTEKLIKGFTELNDGKSPKVINIRGESERIEDTRDRLMNKLEAYEDDEYVIVTLTMLKPDSQGYIIVIDQAGLIRERVWNILSEDVRTGSYEFVLAFDVYPKGQSIYLYDISIGQEPHSKGKEKLRGKGIISDVFRKFAEVLEAKYQGMHIFGALLEEKFKKEEDFKVIPHLMKKYFSAQRKGDTYEYEGIVGRKSRTGKGVIGFVAEVFFTLMWHLNMRITPERRNFVEDVLVPIVEEGLMFLALCHWGIIPYAVIRLVFVGWHAVQDRAPPRGEKRTPSEKLAIPVFISVAVALPLIVFGTTLTGFLLVAGIHMLGNYYVTLSGSHFQKAVLGRDFEEEELKRRLLRDIKIDTEAASEVVLADISSLLREFISFASVLEFEQVFSRVAKRKVRMEDLTGEIKVHFHARGSNKNVYKATFYTKRGDHLDIAMALNMERETGRIQQNEIEDLRWLSTKKRRNLGLVPVMGVTYRSKNGKEMFLEEFIEGETAWEKHKQNELTPDMKKNIITALISIGIMLGNDFPKDLHEANFVITPQDDTVMVDLGSKRLSMSKALKPDQYGAMAEFLFLIFMHYSEPGDNSFIIKAFSDSMDNIERFLEQNDIKIVRVHKTASETRKEIESYIRKMRDYFSDLDDSKREHLKKVLWSNMYLHSYLKRHGIDPKDKEKFIDEHLARIEIALRESTDLRGPPTPGTDGVASPRPAVAEQPLEEKESKFSRILKQKTISSDRPLRICFTCSANIYRGPAMEIMAKFLARQAGIKNVEFSSFGLEEEEIATFQRLFSENLRSETQQLLGVSEDDPILQVKAKPWTRDMIDDADVIIVADEEHKKSLLKKIPILKRIKIKSKIMTFGDLMPERSQERQALSEELKVSGIDIDLAELQEYLPDPIDGEISHRELLLLVRKIMERGLVPQLFQRELLRLGLDGEKVDVGFLGRKLARVAVHARHSDMSVVETLWDIEPDNANLLIAALVHDIGKAGMEEEVSSVVAKIYGLRVRGIEDEKRKHMRIKDFLSAAGASDLMAPLEQIDNPFTYNFKKKKCEKYKEDDKMADFWDAHSLWSAQLLKKAGVPDEIINIVTQHHLIDVNGKGYSVIIHIDRRDSDYRKWTIHRLYREGLDKEKKMKKDFGKSPAEIKRMTPEGHLLLLADKLGAMKMRIYLSHSEAMSMVHGEIENSLLDDAEKADFAKQIDRFAPDRPGKGPEAGGLKSLIIVALTFLGMTFAYLKDASANTMPDAVQTALETATASTPWLAALPWGWIIAGVVIVAVAVAIVRVKKGIFARTMMLIALFFAALLPGDINTRKGLDPDITDPDVAEAAGDVVPVAGKATSEIDMDPGIVDSEEPDRVESDPLSNHPVLKETRGMDQKNADILITTGMLKELARMGYKDISLPSNNKWEYIVIHHTASKRGNVAIINSVHDDRGMNGIAYHFLIGSGESGMRDGQIDPTHRWDGQKRSGGTQIRKYNTRGINVALVGNFTREEPTPEQLDELVYRVALFSDQYGIPYKNIMGHKDVNATSCPGNKFPWEKFWEKLKERKKLNKDLKKVMDLAPEVLRKGRKAQDARLEYENILRRVVSGELTQDELNAVIQKWVNAAREYKKAREEFYRIADPVMERLNALTDEKNRRSKGEGGFGLIETFLWVLGAAVSFMVAQGSGLSPLVILPLAVPVVGTILLARTSAAEQAETTRTGGLRGVLAKLILVTLLISMFAGAVPTHAFPGSDDMPEETPVVMNHDDGSDDGDEPQNQYDENGNLIAEYENGRLIAEYGYDEDGVCSWHMTYDGEDKLLAEYEYGQLAVWYEYDKNDRPIVKYDGEDRITDIYTYTEDSRPDVRYHYDTEGRLTGEYLAGPGERPLWIYDRRDDGTAAEYEYTHGPGRDGFYPHTTRYYDEEGNLVSTITGKMHGWYRLETTYDGEGQFISMRAMDQIHANNILAEFDESGNPIFVNVYEWDDSGSVILKEKYVRQEWGWVVDIYDENGNIIDVIDIIEEDISMVTEDDGGDRAAKVIKDYYGSVDEIDAQETVDLDEDDEEPSDTVGFDSVKAPPSEPLLPVWFWGAIAAALGLIGALLPRLWKRKGPSAKEPLKHERKDRVFDYIERVERSMEKARLARDAGLLPEPVGKRAGFGLIETLLWALGAGVSFITLLGSGLSPLVILPLAVPVVGTILLAKASGSDANKVQPAGDPRGIVVKIAMKTLGLIMATFVIVGTLGVIIALVMYIQGEKIITRAKKVIGKIRGLVFRIFKRHRASKAEPQDFVVQEEEKLPDKKELPVEVVSVPEAKDSETAPSVEGDLVLNDKPITTAGPGTKEYMEEQAALREAEAALLIEEFGDVVRPLAGPSDEEIRHEVVPAILQKEGIELFVHKDIFKKHGATEKRQLLEKQLGVKIRIYSFLDDLLRMIRDPEKACVQLNMRDVPGTIENELKVLTDANPEFTKVRFLNFELPKNFDQMQEKDVDLFHYKVLAIMVLSRVVDKENIDGLAGQFLKYLLHAYLDPGTNIDAFMARLIDSPADAEAFFRNITFFINHILRYRPITTYDAEELTHSIEVLVAV